MSELRVAEIIKILKEQTYIKGVYGGKFHTALLETIRLLEKQTDICKLIPSREQIFEKIGGWNKKVKRKLTPKECMDLSIELLELIMEKL